MKKFFTKRNKAFTLVETLVAISIFTVSILGLMSVLAQGTNDTTYAKRKIIATYLAQEGIEYLRNMRDTYVLYTGIPGNSWSDFKADLAPCNPGTGCGFDPTFPHIVFTCTGGNSCKLYIVNGGYSTSPSGTDSGFTRKVWMTTIGNDEVKVFSTVSWTQVSGTYTMTFAENLFNWIQ